MCTISWGINLSTNEMLKKNSEHNFMQNRHVISFLEKVAYRGEARGKDWIWFFSNVTGLLKYSPFHSKKKVFKFENLEIDETSFAYKWKKLNSEKFDCILVHNRAIPESEVQNDHTQPIETTNFVVIHNGIIANDDDLFNETVFKSDVLKSQIDTEKFAWALEDEYLKNKKSTLDKVFLEVSKKVKWSFAFAIYNKNTKEFLLTTNFQPLSYKIDIDLGYLFFSSLWEYLRSGPVWSALDYNSVKNSSKSLSTQYFLNDYNIVKLPSYTYLYIDWDKNIFTWDLERDQLWTSDYTQEERSFRQGYTDNWINDIYSKGLVLASWGLDTTVVAWIMKNDYNCKELTFLHFDYGHKVEDREAKALRDVVDFYWAKLVTIKLDFLKELFKDSPLMTWKVDETGKWMELSLDYVPVRNWLFMLMAISYAEVNGFHYIWFWGNLSESMAYPDTTAETISKLNDLIPNVVKRNWNIKILDPLRDLLKHEIVKEWIRVWAPMSLTWSCYQDNWTWKHCWKCASCRLREAWMKANGLDLEGNKS